VVLIDSDAEEAPVSMRDLTARLKNPLFACEPMFLWNNV